MKRSDMLRKYPNWLGYGNGWWMNKTPIPCVDRNRNRMFYKKLHYCKPCFSVWEYILPKIDPLSKCRVRTKSNNTINYKYYNAIPTYGQERKNCPPCESRKNGTTLMVVG